MASACLHLFMYLAHTEQCHLRYWTKATWPSSMPLGFSHIYQLAVPSNRPSPNLYPRLRILPTFEAQLKHPSFFSKRAFLTYAKLNLLPTSFFPSILCILLVKLLQLNGMFSESRAWVTFITAYPKAPSSELAQGKNSTITCRINNWMLNGFIVVFFKLFSRSNTKSYEKASFKEVYECVLEQPDLNINFLKFLSAIRFFSYNSQAFRMLFQDWLAFVLT